MKPLVERLTHLTVLAHPSHAAPRAAAAPRVICVCGPGRRNRYLLSVKDVVRLRATCTWLRELFGAAQLRDRLSYSLGSQAGLRRAVNGQQVQLLRFDDDQFGTHDLLAAVCVVEEGDWGEMAEVIELAEQCGNCELPVTLSGADINTHANRTAYMSAPRVLAQLKMVGRHVQFSDGSCLQLFHYGNQWRVILDEPGFRLQVDAPLPTGHLYRRHRQRHDPPVRNSISIVYWTTPDGYRARWVSSGGGQERIDASVSSFAKYLILYQDVIGGRLDGLLTESPHAPVAGCTSTVSWDGGVRRLVFTDGSHPFVASIDIVDLRNTVSLLLRTTGLLAWHWGRWRYSYSTDE
ncbi:unnamed protein product [Vitrella brassicaformis CCMP3155]|uniref:Uncharacterized protein n=1 Tax=Vitrella brassicaformis (strain CCMP3155) TaxID=1169540 RepID=A0A0G4G1M6_VITBC|nr:unnamed protein product [Vitrella brassicaformis CCMP3155]|eukprot:CEM21781.1 unnamed protein product [Vitrella brassicaformis CCMP3155]